MKNKIITSLLLLAYTCSHAQMEQYDYQRELQGISEQWHKVVLPSDIYSKVSDDLADIRIFGVNSKNDTIEAPYLTRALRETSTYQEVNFKLINKSKNSKGYYFTYELATQKAINQIQLDFNEKNFDWRLNVEGSQDQKEWFTLTENYRLLSIKNELTDYQFNTILIPEAKYRYFRLQLNCKEDPGLASAKIAMREVKEGSYIEVPILSMQTTENKKTKETEIDIDLGTALPLSHLKFDISNDFDYYRPVTIRYLRDSIKTEKSTKYNYSSLARGTLSSLENNELSFNSRTVKKLKVNISNQDNEPLKIKSVSAKGYIHELLVRISEPATYYLTYGNKKATKPSYDIARFSDKIPEGLIALQLGNEVVLEKSEAKKTAALFEKKVWLWGVMILIIGLLGWFSLRMIREA